jgi:hypothetical protein
MRNRTQFAILVFSMNLTTAILSVLFRAHYGVTSVIPLLPVFLFCLVGSSLHSPVTPLIPSSPQYHKHLLTIAHQGVFLRCQRRRVHHRHAAPLTRFLAADYKPANYR